MAAALPRPLPHANGRVNSNSPSTGRRSPPAARIAVDQQRGYFTLGWMHFMLFAVGISEWASPSQGWNGFWQPFGRPGIMIAFASLTVISLIVFWSATIEHLSEPHSKR